ncbi:hypothetical protein I3271_09145 [Photobacterium leiognathi]|uniref:FidL-like protein n=1 Tax=Photobacterium leiognathi TaxID=553611 RepID=UPI001EDE76EE|nr:FidL-like protein [Photobacterium leiognathi]MCG3884854.1 hypothetical protein [Photobacterium leiognathi]
MKQANNWKLYNALAALLLVACAVIFYTTKTSSSEAYMHCNAKAIMHFDDIDTQTINANIHFDFNKNGVGYLVVEGYTNANKNKKYLQRYVKFDFSATKISKHYYGYNITKWESSKSVIDESQDVYFQYFIREMSNGTSNLQIISEKLNQKTVLLSSINAPLFVCSIV